MNYNKNIFQICINLNDNIQELQSAKANLVNRNPSYTYHYITDQQEMLNMMEKAFRYSDDAFDQKIYESYILIDGKLEHGQKVQQIKNPIEKDRQHAINVLVSRTDIFRYAMLYKYGGLYCDLSSIADTDIDRDLAIYDFYATRSIAEVRSSFLYGKQRNTICRLVLESITSICNKSALDKSLHQMVVAGPICLSNVLISISSARNCGVPGEPGERDAKIAAINVDHYNSHIEDEESCSYFIMQAPWKEKLHQLDSTNPDKVINSHWLFDY